MPEDASGPDDRRGRPGPDDRRVDGPREGDDGHRERSHNSGRHDDRTDGVGTAGERDGQDDEYRVPIDLSSDDETADGDGDSDGDDDESYGPEPSSTPVEPGEPTIEHAIFVLLGAVAMLLVLFRVLSLPL